MMQRELWGVVDVLALLRALSIGVDATTETGRGELLGYVKIAVAMGARPADVLPEPANMPQVTVITSQARRVNGGAR